MRRCYCLCAPDHAAAEPQWWQRLQLPSGSGRRPSPHHFLEPWGESTGETILTGEGNPSANSEIPLAYFLGKGRRKSKVYCNTVWICHRDQCKVYDMNLLKRGWSGACCGSTASPNGNVEYHKGTWKNCHSGTCFRTWKNCHSGTRFRYSTERQKAM